jgi:hypothetical protein
LWAVILAWVLWGYRNGKQIPLDSFHTLAQCKNSKQRCLKQILRAIIFAFLKI